MRVLLIIPAYNEEANIEKVAAAVEAYAARPHAYELERRLRDSEPEKAGEES